MRLLLLLLIAFSAQAAERITHFHSAIRIGADGVLEVTERIAVIAEGREIREGILRELPTDCRERYGNAVKLPFKVVGGEQVYEVSYRVGRQIGFFERHDELYWNVNCNGWTLAIERVSAEVVLPGPVPRQALKVEAYTGLQGAKGRNYESFTRDGGAAFRSTRSFQPREGMTIVVAFPKGVVAPPPWTQRARWFFADNRGALASSAGLAVLVLLVFLLRRRRKRVVTT